MFQILRRLKTSGKQAFKPFNGKQKTAQNTAEIKPYVCNTINKNFKDILFLVFCN